MIDHKLKRQIELLEILAKGCKKHPAYRAIRKATEKCEECLYVWQARVELNALQSDLWVLQMSYFCSKCEYLFKTLWRCKSGHHKEWVSICYDCIREIRCRLNPTKIYLQLFKVKI